MRFSNVRHIGIKQLSPLTITIHTITITPRAITLHGQLLYRSHLGHQITPPHISKMKSLRTLRHGPAVRQPVDTRYQKLNMNKLHKKSDILHLARLPSS